MTTKLYYKDSYIECFETVVIAAKQYEDKWHIILDQTAFYPGGGGQPCDRGILNGHDVIEVFEKDHTIYHVTKQPLNEGEQVQGQIDFTRRLDYMQQHTAEHLIAGVVYTMYGANNVGFHLNDSYVTADFDRGFTQKELDDIEKRVNQAVFENREIAIKTCTPDEASSLTYRAKIELEEAIRLVSIEGYDRCACCGTQVKTTGSVGLIKIIGAQSYKGGTRMTILAGNRVLVDYSKKLELLKQLGNKFSTKPENTLQAIDKVREELESTKKALVDRTREVLEYKKREYVACEEDIVVIQEDLQPSDQRKLIEELIEVSNKVYIVLVEEKTLKYMIGSSSIDVRSLASRLNEAFDGRGGGNARICQGSLQGSIEDIKEYIKK